jgi:hypothetical protein
MADKKISQLTGATAPLAGTEELPLVQSGTTKKVSVNNLTAGKTVPAAKVNIGSGTQTDDVLHIEGATSATARQRIINTAAAQSSEIRFGDDTGADGGLIIKGGSSYPSYGGANSLIIWNNRNAPITFGTNDANRGEWTAGGDFRIASGNLVIGTAGKGIDFSADSNAAGMTSELLNDYEEGTWTPSLGGDTTYNNRLGYYTKIGRQVTAFFLVQVTTLGTGSADTVSGLPFNASATNTIRGGGSIQYFGNIAVNTAWLSPYVSSNSATLSFIGQDAVDATCVDSIALFGDSAFVIGSIVYFVD